ncbi:hypothetical protein NDU88_002139 [Pleurodeles waltl]|uniref:Uncharacterized protein n=1 Tax=Pleurodeles waltl TaxID=8319 RepID=A0AAV7RDN0_PLEWA|nr:hypothetical protein NDU88_002139 [Pleurodeles waltl]
MPRGGIAEYTRVQRLLRATDYGRCARARDFGATLGAPLAFGPQALDVSGCEAKTWIAAAVQLSCCEPWYSGR